MTPDTSTAPNDSSQATAPGASSPPFGEEAPAQLDPELPAERRRLPGESFSAWAARLDDLDGPRPPSFVYPTFTLEELLRSEEFLRRTLAEVNHRNLNERIQKLDAYRAAHGTTT